MERLVEELDEARVEIEKLKADLKSRTELSDNLKRSHNEQVAQIQELKLKMEKQTVELNEKADEIVIARQMCEELQGKLNEKESNIRCLSSTHEKLRVDFDEKQRKWEDDRRGLVLALDEANEKNIDQEQKIHVLMAEIEGLKGLLSASQTKCLEAEKKAKSQRERRERDDVLFKIEEENRTLQEQFKWKKEQFKHLEEAHDKLKINLKESKKEWEREKSTMVDEICSLQTSLDSQTRISEDLKSRLKNCNQALAHEESRRKHLEVELRDFQARFENVFTECQDTKSQLDCLTTQRDKEIAALRHSLGTKETIYREMGYQFQKLEQENKELLASLKELQEAQSQEAGNSSSVAKLRNKLRSVEQTHRNCSAILSAKEAEWSSQLRELNGELNSCRFSLESKEAEVKELQMEVENCHSAIMQLELQNEEAAVMLTVLKAGIIKAQLNLGNVYAETSLHAKEREENASLLQRQLEVKSNALSKALEDSQEERNKVAALLNRVEALEQLEEQQHETQKELERYKDMLQELSGSHLHFKEQVQQMEKELKEKIKGLCDSLYAANAELCTERENVASLTRKAASLEIIEEKWQLTEKELKEKIKDLCEALHTSNAELCTERENVSTLTRKAASLDIIEERWQAMEKELKENIKDLVDALDSANAELCSEHDKVASLTRKAESLDIIEEKQQVTQKELERYKEMLEESSSCRSRLEETLKEVSDALDSANAELCNEHDKVASLTSKVASLDIIEEKQHLMQEELERCKEMLEESSSCRLGLEETLKEVSDALDSANSELCEERENVASLLRKVESFSLEEDQQHRMQKELEKYKQMLEESSTYQGQLQKKALRKEINFQEKLQEVSDALRRAKSELAAKISEGNAVEFELWIWESIAQSLKNDLEVNQALRRELEASLLAQTEVGETIEKEKYSRIEWLEKELKLRESATVETAVSFESEKEKILRTMREKDNILEDLQKEIGWLEQESLSRELEGAVVEQMGAERKFELEKEILMHLLEEKDQRIDELMQVASSLEHNFNCSLSYLSSELADKQVEFGFVREAWEKIAAAEILAQLEMEEKKLMISELEDDISFLQQKLEAQEKSLSSSQQQAMKIEATLEPKQIEMKRLTSLMETKLRNSEALIEELKSDKANLVEDVMKLSTERENLLKFVAELSDRISQFSNEDAQLEEALNRMVQQPHNNCLRADILLSKYVVEIENASPSPTTKRLQRVDAFPSPTKRSSQVIVDDRSPFRELN